MDFNEFWQATSVTISHISATKTTSSCHLFSIYLLYFANSSQRWMKMLISMHSPNKRDKSLLLVRFTPVCEIAQQNSYSRRSKCRPRALTQPWSRIRHCSMASSTTHYCIPVRVATRHRFSLFTSLIRAARASPYVLLLLFSFFFFFFFLFSARSPQYLGRSPRKFATWSEMDAI